jgi:hypothetical protein
MSGHVLPDILNVIDHAEAHARSSSLVTDMGGAEPAEPAAAVVLDNIRRTPSINIEVPWCKDGFFEDPEVFTCIDRCFFAADDGSYGICPWTVREGDVVVLLFGGRVPFVLRPVPLLNHEPGGVLQYELVGECFVDRDEVMNGEFIKRRMRMSDCEVEVFALV